MPHDSKADGATDVAAKQPAPGTRRWVGLLKGAIKYGVGIGIVAVLVWMKREDLAELRDRPVHASYFVVGFAVCLAATLLTFVRWYLLVRALGLPFRIWDAVRIGFIGVFYNLLIPGAVGGDFVKAGLLAREQSRVTAAIASVFIDRVVGLIALILVGGLASLVYWGEIRSSDELRQIALWTAALVAASVIGLAMLLSRWIAQSRFVAWASRQPVVGSAVSDSFAAMGVYRDRLPVIALTTAMSVIGHIGFVMTLRFATLALSDAPPLLRVHFMIAPLGLLVGAIPVAPPGGLGVGELAMSNLFAFAGESHSVGLVMMLPYRAIQLVIAVIGMLYYLAAGRQKVGGRR